MALGDRVVVGNGYVWDSTPDKKTYVMAYAPMIDENGRVMFTPDGGMVIKNDGGVLAGSSGTIHGVIVNVHRSYLHNHNEYQAAQGPNDFVQMVPVFLDKYQKAGYFPVDNIRIFAGGSAR